MDKRELTEGIEGEILPSPKLSQAFTAWLFHVFSCTFMYDAVF